VKAFNALISLIMPQPVLLQMQKIVTTILTAP